MITKDQAIELVRKFSFFHAQRAGRELWASKPRDVQNVDLMNFSSDCGDLIEYLKHAESYNYRLDNIPKSCWIIFDVPGFYDIYEYEIDRTVLIKDRIEKLWCHNSHDATVVSREDIGKIAFFSKDDAKKALDKIIDNHNKRI